MVVDRLEVPVASTVMILCCGEPVSVQPALRSGSSSRMVAFSAGPQVQAQRVMHTGINECVEIRMPPLAAYALFGGVIAERSCTPIDLLDIRHPPTVLLLDQLQNTRSWSDRFCAVDQYLCDGLIKSRHHIPPRLIWAWKTLERCHGQVAVRELALGAGCSERHLADQFHAYFGRRPKDIARRLRFSHAFDLVTSHSTVDLCAIAVQAGFSDQSHMTREFREFSGLTPNALRAARFEHLPGIPASALLGQ
jgi:AraC-like DNA-binding protein